MPGSKRVGTSTMSFWTACQSAASQDISFCLPSAQSRRTRNRGRNGPEKWNETLRVQTPPYPPRPATPACSTGGQVDDGNGKIVFVPQGQYLDQWAVLRRHTLLR